VSAPAAVPIYLSLDEAAQLLGVNVKTLVRWAREDSTFPVFRRGRVVRVDRERFITWLERQMRRAATRQGATSSQLTAQTA
jgi:excisionase family DNA binding protein